MLLPVVPTTRHSASRHRRCFYDTQAKQIEDYTKRSLPDSSVLDRHSFFNFKWLARQCLPHPENELRQLQDSRVVITRHDDMMLLFQSNFLAQCLGISELDDRIKFP